MKKEMIAELDGLPLEGSVKVRHFHLDDVNGGSPLELPRPVMLKIVEEGDGFLLLRLDREGSCISDTWHFSVDEAKSQALFEYSIPNAAWEEAGP